MGTLRRGWFGSALVIIGTLLGAWVTSDLFKELFRRARPEHWYVLHETSFSYASGHATLSLAFYGTWMYLLWRTLPNSPWRGALLWFLGAWILAIGWSRLALGAHWPTDLLGGYLLGAAWLMLSMTAVDTLCHAEPLDKLGINSGSKGPESKRRRSFDFAPPRQARESFAQYDNKNVRYFSPP